MIHSVHVICNYIVSTCSCCLYLQQQVMPVSSQRRVYQSFWRKGSTIIMYHWVSLLYAQYQCVTFVRVACHLLSVCCCCSDSLQRRRSHRLILQQSHEVLLVLLQVQRPQSKSIRVSIFISLIIQQHLTAFTASFQIND